MGTGIEVVHPPPPVRLHDDQVGRAEHVEDRPAHGVRQRLPDGLVVM